MVLPMCLQLPAGRRSLAAATASTLRSMARVTGKPAPLASTPRLPLGMRYEHKRMSTCPTACFGSLSGSDMASIRQTPEGCFKRFTGNPRFGGLKRPRPTLSAEVFVGPGLIKPWTPRGSRGMIGAGTRWTMAPVSQTLVGVRPITTWARERRRLPCRQASVLLLSVGQGRSSALVPLAQQSRGFLKGVAKWLRNAEAPLFVKVFYGGLFIVASGFLVVSLFTMSAVLFVLTVIGLVGLRLFTRTHPRTMQTLARRHHASPASFVLNPLARMMTENFLFAGIGEIQEVIERDVLNVINSHKKLRRYGSDFAAAAVSQMSLQAMNGEQCVRMEFPVVSSTPAELVVEVLARRYEKDGQEDGPSSTQWQYERVVVMTPDNVRVDITPDLTRRGGKSGRIIDVKPAEVKVGR